MKIVLSIMLLVVVLLASAPAESRANWPNGYESVATMDCGSGAPSVTGTDGVQIALRTTPHAMKIKDFQGPTGTAYYDKKSVEFALSGLVEDAAYVLSFTWWDFENKDRKASVQFASGSDGEWKTVLPTTLTQSFHKGKSTSANIFLPVPPGTVKDGKFRVAFRHEAGRNVVVNAVRLLKKTSAMTEKRILIVTGDDYPGHLWRETGPELAAILREDPRLEITITEAPGILASPLLSHYDAVLLHFKDYEERLPLGTDVWEGLESYVDSGKGLVLAHFGCGAFQEWPGFVNVAGRVWNPKFRAHDPYGKFQVRMTDATHAITQGMKNFKTEDELYTCLDGAPEIDVLCEATSKVDKKDYPMGFVLPDSKGRVFHCTLGHDVNALKAQGTRGLYRKAAAWAVGLPPK